MPWLTYFEGFAAGLVIAIMTTPVGVSGAVFLLPVQLSLLHVPSPSVTPTNLLFNVVAGPGALLRYRKAGQLRGPLARQLMLGTVPGIVLGALVRVFLIPGGRLFRLVAGAVLLLLGGWLSLRSLRPRAPSPERATLSARALVALALSIGVIGGIYGIGGGSILGPILVGRGRSVTEVAPAALASTFAASVVGALSYALLAFVSAGSVAPDWQLGLLTGLGGLVGGYIGARLQPHIPESALRLLLGTTALALGLLYCAQGIG